VVDRHLPDRVRPRGGTRDDRGLYLSLSETHVRVLAHDEGGRWRKSRS